MKTVQGRSGFENAASGPGRHRFLASPNPRQTNCVRCGRPPSAHAQPQVRRAFLATHLEGALKALREDDLAMCAIHVGATQKVLEEDA